MSNIVFVIGGDTFETANSNRLWLLAIVLFNT
jgi:hypothetical protein